MFSARVRALAPVVILPLLIGAFGSPAAPSDRPDPRGTAQLPVVGYAIEGLPDRVIERDAHAMTTLGVDGVIVHTNGRQVDRPSAGARALLHTAHANALDAALLVSNFDPSLGDFNTATAGRLLTSRANSARVANRLNQVVRAQGWDGVTVDLEALRRGHAAGLVRFVRFLNGRLPSGVAIDLDVSASTRYRAHGYDVRGLLRHLDRIVVMAYDQHGPTWSGPGPIGSLAWQRQSLNALLRQAPADRVDLGVAGYGYTWPAAPNQHDGRSLSPRQARQRVDADGANARWRPRIGEWSATLGDGTRIWWSDGRSWRKRVALAERLDLHGLALWRLGSADPLPTGTRFDRRRADP